MIPGRRQSALLTPMPALTQSLWHWCATETRLTCAAKVDFHQLSTSLSRFVVQFHDERRPSSIVDRLGKHAACQPFDVQVFDGNHAVGIDQRACRFVVEVSTLVMHMRVRVERSCGFTPEVVLVECPII